MLTSACQRIPIICHLRLYIAVNLGLRLCLILWISLCVYIILITAMGSRVRTTRITCVNCNICVNNLRRYPALALDTRVTALICSWVYPQIVSCFRWNRIRSFQIYNYVRSIFCLICCLYTLCTYLILL